MEFIGDFDNIIALKTIRLHFRFFFKKYQLYALKFERKIEEMADAAIPTNFEDLEVADGM